MSDEEELEYDGSAWIVDAQTGERSPIPAGQIEGLNAFREAWRSNVDKPHHLALSGWQMADEGHPAGDGKPAYRLVRKTVRTVVFPELVLTYDNLLIRVCNGPITFGEPRFEGTLPDRRVGGFLLPEWGELMQSGVEFSYRPEAIRELRMSAHQETTRPANHVEILYALDDGDWSEYEEMLAAGRAGIASLTAMLDLIYGQRLLGPVITEEVGEIFEDWHWNRLLGGRHVSMESQAKLELLPAQDLASRLSLAINTHLDRDEESRSRLKVASQWYWTAHAQPDPVQRYIGFWLVLEALELGQNANIRPLKASVAKLLGVRVAAIQDPIGRMYGIRNGLVHGSVVSVGARDVERVQWVAEALLEFRILNSLSENRRNGLAAAVGLRAEDGAPAPPAGP